jgi:membrane protein implicated in regulation of membrane protease activity
MVGGFFVLLSVLAGGDELDTEAGIDVDTDLDASVDHDFDLDGDISIDAHDAEPDVQALWLPFFTFKFWTFGTCFFGMNGALLELVNADISERTGLIVSIIVGGLAGWAVSYALHALRSRQSDSMVRAGDLIGHSARVEIPFGPDQYGKVRVGRKDQILEYRACSKQEREFELGEECQVVAVDGMTVYVRSKTQVNED